MGSLAFLDNLRQEHPKAAEIFSRNVLASDRSPSHSKLVHICRLFVETLSMVGKSFDITQSPSQKRMWHTNMRTRTLILKHRGFRVNKEITLGV